MHDTIQFQFPTEDLINLIKSYVAYIENPQRDHTYINRSLSSKIIDIVLIKSIDKLILHDILITTLHSTLLADLKIPEHNLYFFFLKYLKGNPINNLKG